MDDISCLASLGEIEEAVISCEDDEEKLKKLYKNLDNDKELGLYVVLSHRFCHSNNTYPGEFELAIHCLGLKEKKISSSSSRRSHASKVVAQRSFERDEAMEILACGKFPSMLEQSLLNGSVEDAGEFVRNFFISSIFPSLDGMTKETALSIALLFRDACCTLSGRLMGQVLRPVLSSENNLKTQFLASRIALGRDIDDRSDFFSALGFPMVDPMLEFPTAHLLSEEKLQRYIEHNAVVSVCVEQMFNDGKRVLECYHKGVEFMLEWAAQIAQDSFPARVVERCVEISQIVETVMREISLGAVLPCFVEMLEQQQNQVWENGMLIVVEGYADSSVFVSSEMEHYERMRNIRARLALDDGKKNWDKPSGLDLVRDFEIVERKGEEEEEKEQETDFSVVNGLLCSCCLRRKVFDEYSKSQKNKWAKRKCKDCVQKQRQEVPTLLCSCCGKKLISSFYSKKQRRKGFKRKCLQCLAFISKNICVAYQNGGCFDKSNCVFIHTLQPDLLLSPSSFETIDDLFESNNVNYFGL